MAEEITMYQAYDGSVFATYQECKLFEMRLEDEEKIESFLSSPNNIYTKPAHWAVAEKTLQEFCAYIRELPEEPKPLGELLKTEDIAKGPLYEEDRGGS